ncbi:hypothetical protein QOT17_022593 [Balamuthia mandrillaris]
MMKGETLFLLGLLVCCAYAQIPTGWVRVSAPGSTAGDVDGLIPPGDKGNSEVLSMANFDGYVWMGTRRHSYEPGGDVDRVPRIYRYDVEGGSPIEEFYRGNGTQDPLNGLVGEDDGYAVMLPWNGNLYFGSNSGKAGNGASVSAIASGADLGEVERFWTRPEAQSIDAMVVHHSAGVAKLFWAATDTDDIPGIWYSEDPLGPKRTAYLIKRPNFLFNFKGRVTEMISFNGFLYIFYTPLESFGFWLAKAKEVSEFQWTWELVVGDHSASKYLAGMGRIANAKVKALKLANANKVIVATSSDVWDRSFSGRFSLPEHFRPAQIYHFDVNDLWIPVITRLSPPNPARNRATTFWPTFRAGNYGSGFNNIWNIGITGLAQMNGRVFASTFDLSSVRNLGSTLLDALQSADPSFFSNLDMLMPPMFDANSDLTGELPPGIDNDSDLQGVLLPGEDTLADLDQLPDNTNSPFNPVGFDLFVSDDGLTWLPLSVNGFDDGNNFMAGSMVSVSAEDDFYLGTGNLPKGAQLWRLEWP